MPQKKKILELSDTDILELLYKYNVWWQKKDIDTEKIYRSDYFKIKERLENEEILAIIGPRRVGKTILLYQLIKDMLINIPHKNILFLSVDNPAIQLSSSLTRIFNIYQTNILQIPFGDLKKKIYIFLDEIQSFKNWEYELKSLYDLYKGKIKFIVTGSSSTNIVDNASGALVGRIHSQVMLPIKFRDYLRFKISDINEIIETTRQSSKNMRNTLKSSLSDNQPKLFYKQIEIELNNLIPYKERILSELNNYFLYGGYPKIIFTDDERKIKEYLDDYISLTLNNDIRKLFKLKKSEALSLLFHLLCKTTPHLINKNELCNILKIERKTLNLYIESLKTTFLISESSTYSNSSYNIARGDQKKIYTIDIGIRNFYGNLLDKEIFTSNKEIGDIAEIIAASHTNRLIFNLEGSKNNQIYYWKSNEGHEVDIVTKLFLKLLPIEVKYQNSIGNSDLIGLKKFNKRFKAKLSLIITKDELGIIDDSIIKMPLWLYLIMC